MFTVSSIKINFNYNIYDILSCGLNYCNLSSGDLDHWANYVRLIYRLTKVNGFTALYFDSVKVNCLCFTVEYRVQHNEQTDGCRQTRPTNGTGRLGLLDACVKITRATFVRKLYYVLRIDWCWTITKMCLQ